jgi:hypothetical protein
VIPREGGSCSPTFEVEEFPDTGTIVEAELVSDEEIPSGGPNLLLAMSRTQLFNAPEEKEEARSIHLILLSLTRINRQSRMLFREQQQQAYPMLTKNLGGGATSSLTLYATYKLNFRLDKHCQNVKVGFERGWKFYRWKDLDEGKIYKVRQIMRNSV